MKEILIFEVTFASLSKSTGKSSVCLLLAVGVWVVSRVLRSSSVHREVPYSLVGAGGSRHQPH